MKLIIMSTESFDFKIREKLEEISADLIHLHSTRLFDNLVMNKNWQSKPVTRLMFFDMITYTSMGDQDLAIDGLRVSEEMLDDIDDLLWVYDYSTRMKIILPLLFQIWRLGFITTKRLLDHGEPSANGGHPCTNMITGTRFLARSFVNLYSNAAIDERVEFLGLLTEILNDICLNLNASLK